MRENQGFRETIADIKQTFNAGMLTVNQVATYLNCDVRTVKRLIDTRALSALNLSTKKNKQYRVPCEALARFITKEN